MQYSVHQTLCTLVEHCLQLESNTSWSPQTFCLVEMGKIEKTVERQVLDSDWSPNHLVVVVMSPNQELRLLTRSKSQFSPESVIIRRARQTS